MRPALVALDLFVVEASRELVSIAILVDAGVVFVAAAGVRESGNERILVEQRNLIVGV